MYRNKEGYKDPVAGRAVNMAADRPVRKPRPKVKPEKKEFTFIGKPVYVNPDPPPGKERRFW